MARSVNFARAREGTTDRRQVATRTIYATIIVNGRTALAEQRLHTDRTNQDVAYLLQTPVSETADYTYVNHLCQANRVVNRALEQPLN